jgi:hypothetical protein
VIRDLVVTGDPRDSNQGFGILVLHVRADTSPLKGVWIENLAASGFRWAGIYVGGLPTGLPVFADHEGGRFGFADVQVRHCLVRDNVYNGFYVDGPVTGAARDYANRDVTIMECTAADNPGDPRYTANHSGNGILLADTDGGLIDRCVAHGNGASNAGQSGGPVGIWTYASNRVTIQACESFRNRTGGAADGGGFDLDGGVTNSVIQYCYSHDNDGAGFLVWNYEGAPHRLANNVLRYNMSIDDGRKHRYGGISVGSADKPVHDLLAHNNTIYTTPAPGGEPACVRVWERAGDGLRFFNNLFLTRGGVPAVLCEQRGDGVRFRGNAYWDVEGRLKICDGGSYTSLAQWRAAAGQERWRGNDVGLQVNPLLRGFALKDSTRPVVSDAGPGALRLRSGSPLIDAGLDIDAPPLTIRIDRDFSGTAVPQGPRPDIGANEFVAPNE